MGLIFLGVFLWTISVLSKAFTKLESLVYPMEQIVSTIETTLLGDLPGSIYPGPSIAAVFTPEVQRWAPQIAMWAEEYQLDPDLVAVVMQIESCGHPGVHSSAGAQGLFQVMPFHFSSDENPLDPSTNARRGLSYLSRSLEISEGHVVKALAGYNGGHGVINRGQTTWAAETQRYVKWGEGILNDIRSGANQSGTLEAWLQSGGEYLCNQARLALSDG